MQLQIFCLVFINVVIVTIAPLSMLFANYRTTNQEVLNLSQNIFQTQVKFSKNLNIATVLNLNYQLQDISIHSYNLRKQIERFSNDNFTYNQNYVPLLLNQEKVYKNIEDPTKTKIALENQYHASNWYSPNTYEYNEIEDSSKIELVRSDRMNYFTRSYTVNYINQGNSTINLGYQFIGYQSNGIFFTNYLNTSFSDLVDDPKCQKYKYPFNTRCRFWYQYTKIKPGLQIFPPQLIKSYFKGYDLVNLMCQRVKNKNKDLYCVFCKYLFVADLRKFFSGYTNITTHQIIFDPQSLITIFDSLYDININEMKKLDTLITQTINNSTDLQSLLSEIKTNYTQRIIRTQRKIQKEDILDSNNFQRLIQIKDSEDNSYVIIFNQLFTVDKLDSNTDDALDYTQEQSKKYNFVNVYVLIDILSEKQLMNFSEKLLQVLETVFMVTALTLGLIFLIIIIVIFIYSFIFASLVLYPIEHLIQLFEQINLNLNDINEYIIAQNTIFLNQDDQEFFYSLDTRLLYESFTSLVRMLRYSALNLLKEDPSHTLLNLNSQIEFFDKFQNIHSLGLCHNNLANLHFLQGRHHEAIYHYEKSVVFAKMELLKYKEDEIIDNQEKNLNILQNTSRIEKNKHISSIFIFKKKYKKSMSISQEINQDLRQSQNHQIDQIELLQNLFNRKFNYFKCLYGLNEQQTVERSINLQKDESNINKTFGYLKQKTEYLNKKNRFFFQKKYDFSQKTNDLNKKSDIIDCNETIPNLKNNLGDQSKKKRNQNNILQSRDMFFIEELITLANELLVIQIQLQENNFGQEIILRLYILELELQLKNQSNADFQYEKIMKLFSIKSMYEKEVFQTLDQSQDVQIYYQSPSNKNKLLESKRISLQIPSTFHRESVSNSIRLDQQGQQQINNILDYKKKTQRISQNYNAQDDSQFVKHIKNATNNNQSSNYQKQTSRRQENENTQNLETSQDFKTEGMQQTFRQYYQQYLDESKIENHEFEEKQNLKNNQDKLFPEITARNSFFCKSNHNLLSYLSPRNMVEQDSSIFNLQQTKDYKARNNSPKAIQDRLSILNRRFSNQKSLKQQNENNQISQYFINIENQSNEKLENSQILQNKYYSDFQKKASLQNNNLTNSMIEPKRKSQFENPELRNRTQVRPSTFSQKQYSIVQAIKKISYTINANPSVRGFNNCQNIDKTREKNQTHIEFKSLAYDLNCDILHSFLAIAQAEIFIQKNKIYDAATVLTESLEQQKYYSHRGKYQVLTLLQRILEEKSISSRVLQNVLSKYEEMRIFKIAVVICCSRKKNRISAHFILNEIIQNILKQDQDMLGVINYRYGESHFEQLFKLLSNSYLKQNINTVNKQLESIVNFERNKYSDILPQTSNIFSSTQSNEIESIKSLSCFEFQEENELEQNLELDSKYFQKICLKNNQTNTSQPEYQFIPKNISSNIEVENKNENKQQFCNKIFHLCIKNAINNILFDKNPDTLYQNLLFQQNQQTLNINKYQQHLVNFNFSNYKGAASIKEDLNFSICKYIVLIIDIEDFQEDEQYHTLCLFLVQLRVRLLILQLNEKQFQEEKPKLHKERVNQMKVIEIFFTIEKLLQYLHEQRVNIKQLQVDYNIEYY